MTWIIFDEADHFSPAPHFCLPSSSRGQVCLRDYHEDSCLVLVFTHGLNCNECRAGLGEFARRRDEYMGVDAKIVAVIPEPVEAIEDREFSAGMPFPLLSDAVGTARKAYAELMDASLVEDDSTMIFVLDRYNAPYAAWIGREFSDQSIHKEIQSWLTFIGIQCPE